MIFTCPPDYVPRFPSPKRVNPGPGFLVGSLEKFRTGQRSKVTHLIDFEIRAIDRPQPDMELDV